MVLEKLKNETRPDHQALEGLIIPKIKKVRTINDYTHLLALFYGYMQPVELQIDKYITNNDIPLYSSRRKAAAIKADMASIGADAAAIPICADLPAIDTKEAALGALYVLEGSTLGGKIISQMLMKNMELNDDEHISFFSGYKEKTDEMWQTFTSAVNDYAATPEKQNEITAAARETFIKFKAWVATQ